MSKKLKISLITVCLSVLLVLGAVIIGSTKLDNNAVVYGSGTQSVDSLTSFTMQEGAGVRVGKDNPEGTGMRFSAQISKQEYDNLAGNISVGIVIAPDHYACDTAHDLTVENIFGESAIYFLDDNVVTGTPVDGKYEIWHLSNLAKTSYTNDFYEFSGAVTNFDSNVAGLLRQYVARAYVCSEVAGVKTYKMANYYDNNRENNTRAMSYVAKKAYEANDASIQGVKESFKARYVDFVTQLVDGYKSIDLKKLFGRTSDVTVTSVSCNEQREVKDYSVSPTPTQTVTAEFQMTGENNDVLGLVNDYVSYSLGGTAIEYGFQNRLLVVELTADNGAKIKLPVIPYERVISTPQDFIDAITVKTYFLKDQKNATVDPATNDTVAWLKDENGTPKKIDNKFVVDYSNCLNAGYYLLTNDIDMTGYEYKHEVTREFGDLTGADRNLVVSTGNSFLYNNKNGVVTGNQLIGFKGTFEGNGYTVSNISFPENQKILSTTQNTDGGIFGLINFGSVIKNVSFENLYHPKNPDKGGTLATAIFTSTIQNVYVGIKEGSKGTQLTAKSGSGNTFKNVILDYSNYTVDTKTEGTAPDTYIVPNSYHSSFGNEANALLDAAKSENVFVISEVPLATNKYDVASGLVIKMDASNITASNPQYAINGEPFAKPEQISVSANYSSTANVFRFIERSDLASYVQANEIDLSKFDGKYWTIYNGLPIWKNTIANNLFDLTIKQDGETLNNGCVILNNDSTANISFELKFDNVSVIPQVACEEAQGYTVTPNGASCTITATTVDCASEIPFTVSYTDIETGIAFNETVVVKIAFAHNYIDGEHALDMAKLFGDAGATVTNVEVLDDSGANITYTENKLNVTNLGTTYYTVSSANQGIKDYGLLGKDIFVKVTASTTSGDISKLMFVTPVTKAISTYEELRTAINVDSDTKAVVGYFVLLDDIEMQTTGWNTNNPSESATFGQGLASATTTALVGGFQGTFDGLGHSISGFNMSTTFFKLVNYGSVIKNVAFTGIRSTNSGYGVVAKFIAPSSTIKDCYFSFDSAYTGARAIGHRANCFFENVVIDFSNHQKNITAPQEAMGIGTGGGYLNSLRGALNSNSTSNLFYISDLPIACGGNTSSIAERHVFIDGYNGNYTMVGCDFDTENVTNDSVLRFANSSEMATYLQAHSEVDLSAFNSQYWTITNGAPVWKGAN